MMSDDLKNTPPSEEDEQKEAVEPKPESADSLDGKVKAEEEGEGAKGTKAEKQRVKSLYLVLGAVAVLLVGIGIAYQAGAFHQHEWAKATCTEPKKCKECGETEGSPLGHSYVKTIEDPTCTEDGKVISTCSRCGKIKSKNSGKKALGHDASDWRAGSVGNSGYMIKSCRRCGKVVEKKKMTRDELDQQLASQSFTIDSIWKADSGSQYKALHPDGLQVSVTNHSNKTVRNAEIIVCAWDENGLPVHVGIQFYGNDATACLSLDDINLAPNGTWNCADEGKAWNVDSNYTDRMVQFRACVSSVTYTDGTSWDNPLSATWLTMYVDKNL